ncbi:MAG: hypothetical protein Q4G71_05095 [Pseudomonadota bacterium]|nr:hypothetical protein [Pseudomonadota bacterium]
MIATTLVRLCLAGALLAPLAPALAAERFIVLLFEDVAAGADEAAFAACRDARLARAPWPGLVSAQRFALNDVQMFGGVTVALPRMLTLVELTAADADAAARQASAAPACAGADPAKTLAYVYRASGAPMPRAHPDPKVPADGGPRQHYAQVVFTVPNEAEKARFEDWYFSCHMPEILERTGLVSGQRGIEGRGTGPIAPTATLGLYRIALPEGMTIADTRPGPRAPDARDCETRRMMNGELSRGYSYRAIGPARPAGP